LRLFSQPEKLTKENTWFCSTCKDHKEAHKKMDIWSVPRVLIIHLKRFTGELLSRRKSDVLVTFPLQGLDLSEFIGNDASLDGYLPIFDLFAVSVRKSSIPDILAPRLSQPSSPLNPLCLFSCFFFVLV